MTNPGSQRPPGADWLVRQLEAQQRQIRENRANFGIGQTVVGNGGIFTVQGSLVVTGSITVPGTLSSAGAVTAGTDVDAGGNVNATGNLNGQNCVLSTGYLFTPAGRAFTTVTGYAAAYLDSSGKLGINTSSRRYKKNIHKLDYETERILQVNIYEYDRRGKGGAHEVGFLAEEFEELGLYEFVFHEPETGRVQGIHYDKVSVALLAVVKEQKRLLDDILARLTIAGI
jgi:Chaperone of endosialidase